MLRSSSKRSDADGLDAKLHVDVAVRVGWDVIVMGAALQEATSQKRSLQKLLDASAI